MEPNKIIEQELIKYKNVTSSTVKRIIYKNRLKDKICEQCKCSDYWNNLPLTLELHHIDGDCKNNKFDNLQILCPNCHSQTTNFRKKKKITEESILAACTGAKSINQIILNLQRHASGALYKRIEDVIIRHGIDIPKYNYSKPKSCVKVVKEPTSKPCKHCGKEFIPKTKYVTLCSSACRSLNSAKWIITDIDHVINLVKVLGWTQAAIKLGIQSKSTPGCILRMALKRTIKKENLNIDISNLSKFSNHCAKW